jgi:hypothetical protein
LLLAKVYLAVRSSPTPLPCPNTTSSMKVALWCLMASPRPGVKAGCRIGSRFTDVRDGAGTYMWIGRRRPAS